MPLLQASIAMFYYISAPTAEMRMQPSPGAEIVSQAIHSEQVKVIEESDDWIKIETTIDHYPGWIKKRNLCSRPEPFATGKIRSVATVDRCAAHIYGNEDTIYGPLVTLPFESQLEIIDAGSSPEARWLKISLVDGREGYIQRGDIKLNPKPLERENIEHFTKQFIGLPYTWGGRSSFGYDCSGFAQMIYRQMGIIIPRDSKDQVLWDKFAPVAFDNLQAGDLIFFGPADDKIRHVGISLGGDRFIHSPVHENAPYIRISKLSDPLWNTPRGARTLK